MEIDLKMLFSLCVYKCVKRERGIERPRLDFEILSFFMLIFMFGYRVFILTKC